MIETTTVTVSINDFRNYPQENLDKLLNDGWQMCHEAPVHYTDNGGDYPVACLVYTLKREITAEMVQAKLDAAYAEIRKLNEMLRDAYEGRGMHDVPNDVWEMLYG